MERDARESADMCAALEKEYPWIASEKRLFGQPGSDYDWAARDAQAAFAEYNKLEETLSGLSKKLNKRVHIACRCWRCCGSWSFAHPWGGLDVVNLHMHMLPWL